MKNCQEITELISAEHERALTLHEKIQLYPHLMMCKGCRAFYKNTDTLSCMMKTFKKVEKQENNHKGDK